MNSRRQSIAFLAFCVILSSGTMSQNLCKPQVSSVKVNDIAVQIGGSVDVLVTTLNQPVKISLRALNASGGAISPAGYNSVTFSFPKFTSSSNKPDVSLKSETSSDLKSSYGEYFGSEAQGGDKYADYLMVESTASSN